MVSLARFILVGTLFFLLFPQIGGSHDLRGPAWRGQAGSTFQAWEFNDDDNPAEPDAISNGFGSAAATVAVGAYGSGWLNQLPGFGTPTGYWDLGGAGGKITIRIDHDAQPAYETEVCVQVTYFVDIHEAPTVEVSGASLASTQTQTVEHVPTGGDWILVQSTWRITASPAALTVNISSNSTWGSVVDQVVVDARVISADECTVDFGDLSLFCSQWLSSNSSSEANLDGMNGVDFGDFSVLAAHWLENCPAGWPWP